MSHTHEHLSDALTWIERNTPDGIALVARALSETYPASRAASAPTPAAPSGHEDDPDPNTHDRIRAKAWDALRRWLDDDGVIRVGPVDAASAIVDAMLPQLARAREEGRREGIEEAARAIREWSSDTRDRRDLLEVVDALVSGGANKAK